jgi:hypothetical protein
VTLRLAWTQTGYRVEQAGRAPGSSTGRSIALAYRGPVGIPGSASANASIGSAKQPRAAIVPKAAYLAMVAGFNDKGDLFAVCQEPQK